MYFSPLCLSNCFRIVSSLLSFVCFCSLFLISLLFFLPSYRDASSCLDCFLLISSPRVVFVIAVRTEVKTSKSLLSFTASWHHTDLDFVCQDKKGEMEAIWHLLKKLKSGKSFIALIYLTEMSIQRSQLAGRDHIGNSVPPGVQWGHFGECCFAVGSPEFL